LSERSADRLASLAAAAAAVFVFAWTVGFDLTNWDDPVYVTESRLVRDLSPSGLARVFDPRSHVVYDWTPLVTLTYALEVRAFDGPRPALHHATNVGLHAVTAGLVVGLLRAMGFTLAVALFGGLLFAVHPLQVESVAWVSGRKTILATLFGVLCARTYMTAETGRARAGASVLFGAALLSKATLVALPLWLAGTDRSRGRLRAALPWLALLTGISLARVAISVWAQQDVVEEAQARGLVGRLAVLGPVLVRYVGQAVIPYDLAAHYTWPALGFGDPRVIVSWLCVLGLSVLILRAARRDAALGLAGLWVAAALLPVMNLLPGPHVQADRYVYTALVAGGALVGAPIVSVAARARLRPIVAGGLALVLVLFAAQSVRRSRVWQGSIPLWEDTVQRDPEFPVAYGNLGAAFLAEGRLEEADSNLRRALEIEPRLTEARLALAAVLRRQGRLAEARAESDAVLRIAPRSPGGLVFAAELAEVAGEPDRARVLYAAAVQEKPHAVRALERLGLLEAEMGETERGLERVREARRLRPDLREIGITEAWVLVRAGRPAEARASLDEISRAHPDWAEPLYTLALLEMETGNTRAARTQLDGALIRDPRLARARVQRARLRLQAGDRAGAEADLWVAVEVVPFRLTAVFLLVDLLTEDGRQDQALALLEQTVPVRSTPEVSRRITELRERGAR
jgi:tetratricopeptide (TPR) repeat protein